MIVAPAVDLKGGRCVQLVGGKPEEERISLPDPASVARRWRETGFTCLHVVDLDAALGSGENDATVREVVEAVSAPNGGTSTNRDGPSMQVQVGGGVRSTARARALLEGGADRVIVGTRAIDDRAWLSALTEQWPRRVVVALDTRNGKILRKGWTDATELGIDEFLPGLAELPLAGVLSTDVGREGQLGGIDRDGCRRVIELSPHPTWISGGITTIDELAFLEDSGAAGAVLGMAIYTDALDSAELAERWGGTNE